MEGGRKERHTLLIDLLTLLIRRSRIVGVDLPTIPRLIHLLRSTRVWSGNLSTRLIVAERRKLRTHTRRVASAGGSVGGIGSRAVDGRSTTEGGALTFFLGLALVVFLLLAGFPFLADFLELCDDGKKEKVVSPRPLLFVCLVKDENETIGMGWDGMEWGKTKWFALRTSARV